MAVFLLTFVVFALAMLGLAVGWLFNQRALKGSCGGIAGLPGMSKHECACSSPCAKKRQQQADSRLENADKVVKS